MVDNCFDNRNPVQSNNNKDNKTVTIAISLWAMFQACSYSFTVVSSFFLIISVYNIIKPHFTGTRPKITQLVSAPASISARFQE